MSERNDGGPAFPHQPGPVATKGMSLRDHFAGKVLEGAIAGYVAAGHQVLLGSTPERGDAVLAKRVWEIADAVLKARPE